MSELERNMTMGRYVVRLGAIIGLLCGLIFALSSCEKDNLGGSGDIQVNFALNHLAYGEDKVVTRGAGQAALKSETVVTPLKDDLYLYATLEEDTEAALRAGAEVIPVNTQLHIAAYQGTTLVNNAVYKVVSTEGGIESVGSGLSVPSVGPYTFAAYSFNSTGVPPYSSPVSVSPSADLLWGNKDETVVAGENNVSIGMRHMFSRIKVIATATANITALEATMIPNYTASLDVVSGDMEQNGSTTAALYSWEGTAGSGSLTVTSPVGRVYTDGESPTYIRIRSITIGGSTYAGYPSLVDAKFNLPLASGSSYTLRLDFKRELVFAGSNIYWKWNDDLDHNAGGYLTFDAPNVTTNQMYQGVFFKWGALVGVSPAGNNFSGYSSSTPVYIPGNGSWSTTNVYEDFTDIPYMDDSDIGGDRHDTYLTDDAHNTDNDYAYWKAKKGDICRYISENGYGPNSDKYRMPTSFELGGKDSYYYYDGAEGWIRVGGSTWESAGMDVPDAFSDGTYPIPYGASNGGIAFPTSGYRHSGGYLYDVGREGFYWSISAYTLNNASYSLHFRIGDLSPYETYYRQYGFPVRCVKN
jgi:hypothetical protein